MPPPEDCLAGQITTLLAHDELVIRLSGEIDLCLRPQLLALARWLAEYDGPAVVDLTDVRFGDGTLAAFLAERLGQKPTTVRAPTRLSRELLLLYGVRSGVRVVG